MSVIVSVLILVTVASILVLMLLAIVIWDIHTSDHRMSLGRKPHTRSEVFARRVMGVHSELDEKTGAP
jgi:hypothetical protein